MFSGKSERTLRASAASGLKHRNNTRAGRKNGEIRPNLLARVRKQSGMNVRSTQQLRTNLATFVKVPLKLISFSLKLEVPNPSYTKAILQNTRSYVSVLNRLKHHDVESSLKRQVDDSKDPSGTHK